MKIPAIKQLVESYSKDQLVAAEAAIADEQLPNIDIPGDDDGEQLTHAFAAIQIMETMESKEVDFKTALREYTSRVRNSIS